MDADTSMMNNIGVDDDDILKAYSDAFCEPAQRLTPESDEALGILPPRTRRPTRRYAKYLRDNEGQSPELDESKKDPDSEAIAALGAESGAAASPNNKRKAGEVNPNSDETYFHKERKLKHIPGYCQRGLNVNATDEILASSFTYGSVPIRRQQNNALIKNRLHVCKRASKCCECGKCFKHGDTVLTEASSCNLLSVRCAARIENCSVQYMNVHAVANFLC